jgi:hypothetical protein
LRQKGNGPEHPILSHIDEKREDEKEKEGKLEVLQGEVL